ncbi:uncharacterized protein GGS22DRAFT_43604 [Annulohypoxylon maeteangense]|uniref:uncharacterized protein n=1 Tax=Annulohypoxylon maeteangense TaxID=1927788 RepID=UPI0020076F63|nr:uncharacterized protein GGS22DRAFT_43604 [Annulohypoxylon maeteangense]KAI0882406.1 hypothetical protein GGS22DRAFT_43604 [Annulohypoxylon maeteangense]
MAPVITRAVRAISAVPFLFLTAWSFGAMDLDKMASHTQPFADSGVIEWDGGKVDIIDHFHNVDILDQLWRGGMATFSTSTFGYDSVSSWQVFSFLIDLGPIYAIWILESYRRVNAWTPIYLPTIFTVAAQLFGIGPVSGVFYFLYITFGPTPSELARSTQSRSIWNKGSIHLILIILLLHTSEIFAMFLAPDFATRHYWTWAWQLTPLWIGVANVLFDQTLRLLGLRRLLSISLAPLLIILGFISSSVWLFTLSSSPYPLTTLFIPDAEEQFEFITHTRRALQADELGVVVSSLLWLVYSFFDLYIAGLVGWEWLVYAASLGVATLCLGPGTAISVGWYLRERALVSAKK